HKYTHTQTYTDTQNPLLNMHTHTYTCTTPPIYTNIHTHYLHTHTEERAAVQSVCVWRYKYKNTHILSPSEEALTFPEFANSTILLNLPNSRLWVTCCFSL